MNCLKAAMGIGLVLASVHAGANSLVYCSEGSPAGFDPALYTTSTVFDAAAEPIFNRLVQFKRGSTEIQPGLAESWSTSADGTVYTFHLRQNVPFHTTDSFKPSRYLEADDVVFTFERMLDKSRPFNKAFPVDFPYFDSMGLRNDIESVSKTDTHTVSFKLRARNAPFLQNLAMSFASIQSKEYADQLLKAGAAAELDTKPVGTGPFQFESFKKDEFIKYRAFKGYWDPTAVKVDKLVFKIEQDADKRQAAIRAGECDVSAFLRPADVDALASEKSLQILSKVGFNLGYIAYNVEKAPFDNLDFRKALDAAIDKEAIIQQVYGGKAEVASNGLPPTQWGYVQTQPLPRHDFKLAKDLLAKSGVKQKTTVVLWELPVQRPYNPNPGLMAKLIKSYWAEIGVDTEIRSFEWAEYNRRATLGEHQAMLIGWTGDNGDPDNWLGTLFSCDGVGGNNDTRWCDKAYTSLIKQAKSTTEMQERLALYSEAQTILMREQPFSPIAHSVVYQSVKSNIDGFVVSPMGLNSFYGVSVK